MKAMAKSSWGFAAVAIVIGGCGGSGGGSTSVSYTTTWSARTRASGTMQRITLLRADGGTVSTQVVTQGATPTSTATFTGLNAGTYRVRAELFANAGSSTVLGALQETVPGTGTLSTMVDGTVSSLSIDPSTPSLGFGSTLQVYASGRTAAGNVTFVDPASIAWSSSAERTFTVNASGLISGITSGSATLTATQAGTGLTKSATVNVDGPPRAKWTVLVFLSSANDLQPYSVLNMNQMEKIAQGSDVKFVVQWKQLKSLFPESTFDGTRRMLVTPDSNTSVVNSQLIQDMGKGIDMSSGAELRKFVEWGMANYPADRTCLVVWDHGDGWRPSRTKLAPPVSRAISWDDEFGTALEVWDMRTALQGLNLEVVSFDACDMQMAEVGGELTSACKYMVGSQDLTPGAGYPYDKVFAPMFANPSADTKSLLQAFSTQMVTTYPTQTITQSSWDMSKFGALSTAIDGLASSLIANRTAVAQILPTARLNTVRLDPSSSIQFYFDLSDLAQNIKTADGCPAAVVTACNNVQTAVTNTVLWHGASTNRLKTRGVSIDFSPSNRLNVAAYQKLQLAINTQWGTFLAGQ